MDTVEEIRQQLIESELLSPQQVDAELQAWRKAAGISQEDGEPFLDWLVEHERLTEFQADAIAAGHAGPFRLGPYEVFEQIAPGRLGGMFRAIHRDFQQPVTLKVFPSSLQHDPEKLARMGREVRIFSELDNPHVLRSFQVGQVGEVTYIALEELRGETLAHRLERDGRLPFEEACRIMRDVAVGLEHLHQNDVLHRDLQPAYIWITDNGRAKVMEFGAARDAYAALDAPDGAIQLTVDSGILGNFTYAAPELMEDSQLADARSDLYSLGCVLYHALAGRPPFEERNPVRLVLKHATAPVPLDQRGVGRRPRTAGRYAAMAARQTSGGSLSNGSRSGLRA
jgi:eukaryotic-like serine/threonine-protein kinase